MTEENASLITATILDPRFKKLHFLPDNADKNAYYKFAAATIDKKLGPRPKSNAAETPAPKKAKRGFLSEDDDDVTEFTTTLQELKCYSSKYPKMVASKFYSSYGKNFPRLEKAADIFLLSPATSVPVERVFSHASFQVNVNIK